MKLQIVNGKILSIKENAVEYERTDGQVFTYNTMITQPDNSEDTLIGKYLQVEVNTDPADYYINQAITTDPV